jgi:hypothetical protein
MGRTVVTKQDVERRARELAETQRKAAAEGSLATEPAPDHLPVVDNYRDRLMKYIPADIIAIYLTLTGLLKMADPNKTPVLLVGWIIFAVIVLVSVPWQRRVVKVEKWKQVGIGTLAFVFWAISLGDPFTTSWAAWYQPLYGSMLLVLYTFLIPLLEVN